MSVARKAKRKPKAKRKKAVPSAPVPVENIQVGHNQDFVLLDFGQPVRVLALQPEKALGLGRLLAKHCRELSDERLIIRPDQAKLIHTGR